MTHQFTINESHQYDAREVADLLSTVYLRGQESTAKAAAEEIVKATTKAKADSRFSCFRWFVQGFLTGAFFVIVWGLITAQVIA